MVRFFLLVTILHFYVLSFAQIDCDSIYLGYDWRFKSFPTYKIGCSMEESYNELYKFIQMHIVYPQTAKEDEIEGSVLVSFLIDSTGTTSQCKILQGVREDLDNEALRVVRLLIFEKPAIDYFDKLIGMCFQLPIRFTLNEDKPSRNCLKSSENGKPKHKNKKKFK